MNSYKRKFCLALMFTFVYSVFANTEYPPNLTPAPNAAEGSGKGNGTRGRHRKPEAAQDAEPAIGSKDAPQRRQADGRRGKKRPERNDQAESWPGTEGALDKPRRARRSL